MLFKQPVFIITVFVSVFVHQDGVWHLHSVPNRMLFNRNHVCSHMYTREVTVIDEKGKIM